MYGSRCFVPVCQEETFLGGRWWEEDVFIGEDVAGRWFRRRVVRPDGLGSHLEDYCIPHSAGDGLESAI